MEVQADQMHILPVRDVTISCHLHATAVIALLTIKTALFIYVWIVLFFPCTIGAVTGQHCDGQCRDGQCHDG